MAAEAPPSLRAHLAFIISLSIAMMSILNAQSFTVDDGMRVESYGWPFPFYRGIVGASAEMMLLILPLIVNFCLFFSMSFLIWCIVFYFRFYRKRIVILLYTIFTVSLIIDAFIFSFVTEIKLGSLYLPESYLFVIGHRIGSNIPYR